VIQNKHRTIATCLILRAYCASTYVSPPCTPSTWEEV
jgi:hypothetical protein